MRRGGGAAGGADVVAGVIAAGGFLGMVFLLQMPLALSALLAVAAYAGIWLAGRAGGPAAPRPVSAPELVQRIEQLAGRISNPQVQRRLAEICAQARGVLAFLDEHPEKAESWRGVLTECLHSTLTIEQRYLELSRFFDDPSRQSMQEVETLLQQVAATFANLRRRLVDEGAADLSADMTVFRSTLQALDEVNVVNRGGSEP